MQTQKKWEQNCYNSMGWKIYKKKKMKMKFIYTYFFTGFHILLKSYFNNIMKKICLLEW